MFRLVHLTLYIFNQFEFLFFSRKGIVMVSSKDCGLHFLYRSCGQYFLLISRWKCVVTPNCLCGFLTETFFTSPQKPTVYFTIVLCRTVLRMFFRLFLNCFSLEEAPRSRSLPSLSVMKTLTAINPGQLAVFISSLSINGYECEGYGFKIMNCKSFVLKPNTSRKIEIT